MNNPLEPPKNLQSGKIVVNSDEWTLSKTGFTQAPDTATFVTNIAKWFTGRRSTGKFHAYSTNFGFTEYDEGELILVYDFFGSETDTLSLDGKNTMQILGAGGGILKQNQIPLGASCSTKSPNLLQLIKQFR